MSFERSNMFSSSSITMFLPVFSEIRFLTHFLASKKAANICLMWDLKTLLVSFSNNRDWIFVQETLHFIDEGIWPYDNKRFDFWFLSFLLNEYLILFI